MKYIIALIILLAAGETWATDYTATISDPSGISWARARQNLLAKGLRGDQNGQTFSTDAAYFQWYMQQQAIRMKQQKTLSGQ